MEVDRMVKGRADFRFHGCRREAVVIDAIDAVRDSRQLKWRIEDMIIGQIQNSENMVHRSGWSLDRVRLRRGSHNPRLYRSICIFETNISALDI